MELLQLKYFKTVAEVGKISAAAESLFISAPALSTSISRLEKELGVQLFDRSNNRIALNRQGQIFLRYVNQVFASLECAREELRQSVLQQGQHVSVVTTSSNLWVDLITAFSQEHPHFTLSCTSLKPDQLSGGGLPHSCTFLLAEEEDVAPYLAAELENVELFADQPAIMVHPEHPLAEKDLVEMEELQGETLVLPMEGNSLYIHLEKIFEASGMPHPSGHAYSYLVYNHMVEEGLGISFTTMRASRIGQANVRYIPIRNPNRPWSMRLYWRKSKPLTADETIFRDFVKRFYRVGESAPALSQS